MSYLVIFFAGYASVFLLGFQSRSVNHGNYLAAAIGSFLIAQMQTTLWGSLFSDLTWTASLVYGLSGCCGITSSMFVHQRLMKKPDQTKPRDQTMHRPTFLIAGYARHGKDTVAELLAEHYGLKFVSSSFACAEIVMMPYFASIGQPYASVEECYADRVNHRAVWHDQIAAYNTPDKAKLAREILERADAYVGMRCDLELAASRKLFDHILWVDASGRGIPPEDRSSCKLVPTPDMILVDNSGTLRDLEEKVHFIAERLGLQRVAKAA